MGAKNFNFHKNGFLAANCAFLDKYFMSGKFSNNFPTAKNLAKGDGGQLPPCHNAPLFHLHSPQ